jgi:hypothetical protein
VERLEAGECTITTVPPTSIRSPSRKRMVRLQGANSAREVGDNSGARVAIFSFSQR